MNDTRSGNGTTSSNPDDTNNQFPDAAMVTMIEVVVIAGFLIVLLVASISATSCVIVRKRKRRKFEQDESGRRVVCMVPSTSPPPPVQACIAQCGSNQAHPPCHKTTVTLVNEAPSSMTNPQVHVSRENGKVIESFYVFELEESCSEDDEYDDIVQHTKEESYDDVVHSFPPAHTSQLEDLVDMDTLSSKIATLTRSSHCYEDVAVATSQQCHDALTECNGYESLNTASESDADSVNSQDEDCYYNIYTKPPTNTGTLVRELQHMSITQTIKANEVQ